MMQFLAKLLQVNLFVPSDPASTPRRHQKTVRFSDVFRGYRKGALGTNLIKRSKTVIKGDLRPKTHPCFYGIILMILWEKSLSESFDQFSQSYEVIS